MRERLLKREHDTPVLSHSRVERPGRAFRTPGPPKVIVMAKHSCASRACCFEKTRRPHYSGSAAPEILRCEFHRRAGWGDNLPHGVRSVGQMMVEAPGRSVRHLGQFPKNRGLCRWAGWQSLGFPRLILSDRLIVFIF